MRRYLNKFVNIALIFVLCVLSLTACSVSDKVKMPSDVNDEQIELINYVVENGQYNDEQNSYYIQKNIIRMMVSI